MTSNTTKELIIKEANKLFLEKGYHNVTIVDICKACKISKTTFYYHLKSKEDIIIDFYDSSIQNISKNLIYILSKDSYWEQLMVCFESLVDETYKYGTDFFSQMMIMNLREDFGSFDFRDELTQIAIMIIKKAQESGQIRNKNNAEDLYKVSCYAFLGYEMTWCIKKGNYNWRKELRSALENIYDVAPDFRK